MSCAQQDLVDAHFAGTISPSDERVMREHLLACDACDAHYRRRQMLAKLDPAALKPDERIARGLGLRPREEKRGRVILFVAAALSLAAILFLVLRPAADKGFTPRGGLINTAPVSSISVFRLPKDGALLATAEGNSLHVDDELAFSYRSEGNWSHLMIFAVDESQRVYWFYPAWTNEADTPTAIEIAHDPNVHELREAIRHHFAGRRLAIHGLFLDHALNVRQVEDVLRQQNAPTTPVNIGGATDRVTMLEVEQ